MDFLPYGKGLLTKETELPYKETVIHLINLVVFGCAGSLLLQELFSSCREWGYCLIAVLGLLIAMAPLIVDRGL